MSPRRALACSRRMAEIGRRLFPYRGIIWGFVGLGVYLFSRPSPFLFRLGILCICLGEVLRLWASGYIKTYRGPMEEVGELVTSGPYAYVRNPLYLANGLIGLGITLLSGILWAIVLFGGIFAFLYGSVVRAEEAFLEEKFGEAYREYARYVPRFFPRLTPYSRRKGSFSFRVLWEKESITLCTLFLVVLLFYLRGFGFLQVLDRLFFGL